MSTSNVSVRSTAASIAETVMTTVSTVSLKIFHGAEYVGEKLADCFGITSPRYQYYMEEAEKLREEELEIQNSAHTQRNAEVLASVP